MQSIYVARHGPASHLAITTMKELIANRWTKCTVTSVTAVLPQARELFAAEAAREQCRASSVQEQRRFAAQLQELAVGGASLTVILDDIRGQVDSFEVGYRQAQEKLRQLDE
ncbi:unnamed protein product, partial [Polarella glacialis]